MCIPLPSKHLRNHSCVVSDALWNTICILETSYKPHGDSQENTKVHEKCKVFHFVPRSWQTSIITPGHSPTLYDTLYTSQNCASPFGALMVHRNRQSAKSMEIIERTQLFREWSTFSKPYLWSFSGYRIFLDLSSTPSEPVHIKAHLGRF